MRELIFAALFTGLVIVTVEVGFRATGGVPSSPQGKTPIEFQWKVRHAGGLSQRRAVYVIGDSRVEWGFAERVFNDALRDRGSERLIGVNAGSPAASAAGVARSVLATHTGPPGVLVLNFSPCSFFQFEQSPGPAGENLKLQDLLDDRIDTFLKQHIWTWGRRPSILVEHARRVAAGKPAREVIWYDRGFTSDGCLTLKGRYNDDEQFDVRSWTLEQYRKMFAGLCRQPNIPDRMAELVALVESAKRAGWTVLLVRIPVGEPMRQLESTLPPTLHLDAAAAALRVPTIDYQSDPRVGAVNTVDESHLDPQSARRMAMLLAEDVTRLLESRNQ